MLQLRTNKKISKSRLLLAVRLYFSRSGTPVVQTNTEPKKIMWMKEETHFKIDIMGSLYSYDVRTFALNEWDSQKVRAPCGLDATVKRVRNTYINITPKVHLQGSSSCVVM